MVGTSLSHYRIESELGRGGMGIVYEAIDPKLNRTVAIKVLPSVMLTSQEDRSRFYREARAAAALSHPNIATVYAIDEAIPEGSGSDDVRPFIAMEYIDGPSLDRRIAEGPLDLNEAVRIAIQVASALEAAHEQDIVHRDIKAANIMLTSKGDVKVLDFGLAKTAQSTMLTQMGSTLGTAAYMSPEQSRGEEVDGRADLWSLGVLLYEMISGRLPFRGDYEQAVLFEILNQDPEPLTALRTGVPMALEGVVDKLLQKDRSLRYQGAADLIADLKRLELEGKSSVGRPGVTRAPVTSVHASRPIPVTLQVISAVILFCLGALVVWLVRARSTQADPIEHPIHLSLVLPDSVLYMNPQWSGDGTKILFSADEGSRKGFIVEYDLNTGTLRDLADADLNRWPKYSPDGRSIFFINGEGMLMRKGIGSAEAGPVTRVVRRDGLTWISPNEIVFSRQRTVLVKDLSSGLEDTLNPDLDSRWFHHPSVTADSSILFVGTYSGIKAIDLSTRELLPDLEIGYGYLYDVTSNGYVVYELSELGTAWARKFNSDKRAYEGPGFVLFSQAGLAISRNGHLIYKPRIKSAASVPVEPIYVYSRGKRVAAVGDEGRITDSGGDTDEFRVSPDGRYVAVRFVGGGIVRFEMSSRTVIELVDRSVPNTYPTQFTYDGKWLYYYALDSGVWGVYRVDTEGAHPPEPVVVEDRDNLSPSVSRDGATLVFVRSGENTDFDIWTKDLGTGDESPLVVAEGRQWNSQISPDGRFVAFESRNAEGESSVLVRDLDQGRTVLVADRVMKPRWDWDAAYLYYESRLLGEIYRVAFNPNEGMTFGDPEVMYSNILADHIHWAILPGEEAILVATPGGGDEVLPDWEVVLNWASTLEE